MPEPVNEVVLRYKIDEQALRTLVSRSEQFKASLKETTAAAKGIGAGAGSAASGVADYTAATQDAAQATDSLSQRIQDSGDELGKLAAQYRDVADAESKVGKAKFGDIGGLASRAGGALKGLGAGGAGDVLQAVGDLGDLSEVADKFKEVKDSAAAAIPQLVASAAAYAPVAIAAGAIIAPLLAVKHVLDQNAEAGRQMVAAHAAEIDRKLQLIDIARTSSSQEINQANEVRKAKIQVLAAEALRLTAERDRIAASGKTGLEAIAARQAVDTFNTSIAGFEKQIAELSNEVQDTTPLLQAITAREAEAAALKQQTDALLANADAAQQAAVRGAQFANLTQEQAGNTLNDMAVQMQGLFEAIAVLQNSGSKTEEVKTKLADYNRQLDSLKAQYSQLTDLVNSNVLASEAANKRNQALADTQKKYVQDRIALEQQYEAGKTAANKRLNDALTAANDQAAKAAEDALTRLNERRTQATDNFANANAEAQARYQQQQAQAAQQYQRGEEQAARQHARDLVRIRREGKAAEEEAVSNRDFGALARIRKQTALQIASSNDQYNAERAERLIAYKQKQADDAAQYELEQDQREKKYKEDLANAQKAYQTDLVNAQNARVTNIRNAVNAYNTEIRDLQTNLNNQITAKQNALREELTSIIQFNTNRRFLEDQYYRESVDALKAAIAAAKAAGGTGGGGGGGNIPPGAFGAGNTSKTSNTVQQTLNINIASGNTDTQNRALVNQIRVVAKDAALDALIEATSR